MANRIEVSADLCKGCGLCVQACPKKILALSSEINIKGYHPVACVKPSDCIACAFCAKMCPDCVISVFKGEDA